MSKTKPTLVPLKHPADPKYVRLCNLAWEASRDTTAATLTASFGNRTATITITEDYSRD